MTEREIFIAALHQPDAAQRAAFLDRACGTDQAQRDRVEELLSEQEQLGSFLEQPADGPRETGAFTPAQADGAGRGSPDPAVPTEEVGTVIGPYKLVQTIGEGGMGTVYLAQQTAPVKRLVALKLIKPDMDSRQVIARFEAERQALALMEHPNIARVLDAGTTTSGRPYFVMELVKGVPITKYCDEHRLTPKQRLELFVPICQAIQHAHQKGIIHRDIKPSNVLVALYDSKPVPKVIDFGIAKAAGQQLTERTLVTGFGAIVGTLEYMSPEQAVRNQLDIDTRSDIYSLGVLLYELLTGTTPLERKRLKDAAILEVLRIIREEEPPRPSTRLSTADELPSLAANRGLEPKKLSGLVRGELDWVVMKCLEKDRGRRYETASGLARDIERYLADEPVQACPPSAAYRLRKFARRHKVLLTAASVVAVTLLVAAAAVTWKWREAERAREHEQTAKGRAEESRDEAKRAEKKAKKAEKKAKKEKDRALQDERTARLREAEALIGEARGTRLSRRPGQRFEALAAVQKAAAIGRELGQPAAWFDGLRTEAIAALCLPDLAVAREWPLDMTRATAFTVADNFERYAWADMDGNVSVRRLADHAELYHLPGVGALDFSETLRFSPNGRFLVQHFRTTGGWRNRLWKLDGAEPKVVLSAADGAWDFSPDSRQVAVPHVKDREIRIHATETGRELRRFRFQKDIGWRLRWNPWRPLLAVINGTALRTINVKTGAVVAEAAVPGGSNWLDWHPEGRLLAVATNDRKICLWDTVTRKLVLPPFEGHKSQGIVVGFNRAGDRLLSTDWNQVWRLWDTRNGQLLLTVPAGGDCLRFSAGDRLVAADWSLGTKVRLYRFLSGSEFRTVVHRAGTSTGEFPGELTRGSAILDAEGRLLAYSTRKGIALVDVARCEDVALLPLPDNVPLRFEPKGEALWTYGGSGLLRWPLGADPANKERRRVGPPQKMANHMTHAVYWGSSLDVHVVAIPNLSQGALLWHRTANHTITLAPQEGVRHCAVSPDGRWVATGSHGSLRDGVGVKVWNAQSGQHVANLPVPGGSLRFSPDGKWLLTSPCGARIWRIGTWHEGPALGGPSSWSFGTFSPDSKLLALSDVPGVVRLLRTATGKEVARLTAPEQTSLVPQCFTPDGSQLITAGHVSEALHIFDLRAIRKQLQALKLDWGAPPFPPAKKDPPPLEVTVDLGMFDPAVRALFAQADFLRRKGELAGALAAIQKAHALAPDDAELNHWLAWSLAICPDPKLRDAKRAVALTRKLVAAAPTNAWYWRTLGLAHHYAGDDKAAVKALNRSLELRRSGEPFDVAFDYFPLAAAHHRLGNEEARKWYDRGVAWMAAHQQPYVAEMALLRAEAESLLGIKKPLSRSPEKTAPEKKE
jgi:serine/threonine protein kinase/WD40 repeat protein